MTIQADLILDAKGLACPMPVVKTKKTIEELEPGRVLEVQATDKGSIADLQSWAARTGHAYLGHQIAGDVIHHYLRKANPSEIQPEQKHPVTVTNDDLQAKLEQGGFFEQAELIDVREPAEYAFGHIPGAVSIPLGVLEQRMQALNPDKDIYVICRTGNRSDAAAQLLAAKGYTKVINVIPGMSRWTGPGTHKE